jgi:hypothetical protein
MKTARSVWVGFGLLLFATGAVTISRAQQAGEKRDSGLAGKRVSRERVLELRTEVDVLQMEYDAARVTLVEWLRDSGKAELMGIDMSSFLAEMGMGFGTVRFPAPAHDLESAPKPAVPDDRRQQHTAPPAPRGSLLLPAPPAQDEPQLADMDLKKIEAEMAAWSKKNKEEIDKRLERRKQEFARLARSLNEKRLELSEAEKQYQREAP